MQPRLSPAGTDASFEPAPLPSAGRAVAASASWRLFELLGGGGEAQVWRAVDPAGHTFALKIPRSSGAGARQRVEREHELLAALAHPSVVATAGVVALRGRFALALEYLPGGDLVPLLGAHPRHWIGAALAVCAALAHLHERGFVHRDVKARNVLFGSDARARLVDFSSALPIGTRTGQGGTTAAHRAPVRCDTVAGTVVEAESDTYAFAVLLYELLAGRLPYGVAGPRAGAAEAPVWPLTASADPAAITVAERVVEALGGRRVRLSALGDVLESAATAYRSIS